ncbi:MAG: cell wall-binding repeat-containing protein [Coriobacteriia bacterium]
MPRRPIFLALFATFLFVLPTSAYALVEPLSLSQITELSDHIVQVNVSGASVRAQSASAVRPMPVTDIRVNVTRVYKGSRHTDFTLTQPGGTVGDVTLRVPELPDFTPGERAILFLDERGVVAGDRGKLEIVGGNVPELGMTLTAVQDAIANLAAGRPAGAPLVYGEGTAEIASALGITEEGDTGGTVTAAGVTGITPSRSDAGVGDIITISGTDFGTTRGSGTVSFLLGNALNGSRKAASTYTAWSNTQISCVVPDGVQGGSVVIITGAGTVFTSSYYDIGFSTDGSHVTQNPLVFRVNENTADVTGEGAAFAAALAAWSNAGSNFRTQKSATPGTRTAYPPAYDATNDAYFAAGTNFPTGTLALSYLWFSSSGGNIILEADMIMNDGAAWSIGAVSGRYDIETIVLHEVGHAVGLDDQYAEYHEVMGAAASNATRRALSQSEREGAVYLYGVDASLAPGAPQISSATHVTQDIWVPQTSASFAFSASAPAGIGGYSYLLNTSATTIPDSVSEGTGTTASFTSLADGEHYFHVRATNTENVWGPASHYRVRIDTQPPVSQVSVPATSVLSAQVIMSAADSRSGVGAMRYTLDGGPVLGSTGTINVTTLGTHTVSYWSVDVAGNAEVPRQVSFEVLPRDAFSLIQVQGPDRFATAVESSKLGFASGAGTVLIATGRNWPDALGASALAGALDAPLLLVDTDSIPPVVAAEIARLKATKAIIIGGTGAVSAGVQAKLVGTGSVKTTERIAGADRYDTARRVAARAILVAGSEFDGGLIVATGAAYADALAAAPASAARHWPVVLVAPQRGLDAATRSFVTAWGKRVYVMGGTSAVSAAAYQDLEGISGADAVKRIAGADRYSTAAQVASWGVAEAGLTFVAPAIATGLSPYDALAGGVVQGRAGSVLLLTDPAALSTATADTLVANEPAIREVRILGGAGAIGQPVRDRVVSFFE